MFLDGMEGNYVKCGTVSFRLCYICHVCPGNKFTYVLMHLLVLFS